MKSYTDLEQSKKLAEILSPESADMSYRLYREEGGIPDYHLVLCPYIFASWIGVPAWSLAALLDVLPKIHGLKPMFDLEECSIQYSGIDIYIIASNPVDVCYDTILKLHEQNLI